MLVHNSKTNRPVLKRKYIQGKGFTDSLMSSLRSVGSYVAQNKDLIAKPLLGAVGDLAATGISQGVPALIKYINNKNKGSKKEEARRLLSKMHITQLYNIATFGSVESENDRASSREIGLRISPPEKARRRPAPFANHAPSPCDPRFRAGRDRRSRPARRRACSSFRPACSASRNAAGCIP